MRDLDFQEAFRRVSRPCRIRHPSAIDRKIPPRILLTVLKLSQQRRGETYHVRTRVRSPQTNGVIGRFFGTLKYGHLYRAPIDDGGALAMETARFRDIYNRIRPHQALDDRTPRQAYLDT